MLIDADLAADMLMQADTLAKNTSFAWALVRPPWSTNTCTKAQVFFRLKQHVDVSSVGNFLEVLYEDIAPSKRCTSNFLIASSVS